MKIGTPVKPLFELITPIGRAAVFRLRTGNYVVYDGVGRPEDFATIQLAFACFERIVAKLLKECSE